jgi:hypothetical protein
MGGSWSALPGSWSFEPMSERGLGLQCDTLSPLLLEPDTEGRAMVPRDGRAWFFRLAFPEPAFIVVTALEGSAVATCTSCDPADCEPLPIRGSGFREQTEMLIRIDPEPSSQGYEQVRVVNPPDDT